ncbi:MAG: hypothetical protein GY716_22220 [bacterium]|nr:hypothetical protein [bacterium]
MRARLRRLLPAAVLVGLLVGCTSDSDPLSTNGVPSDFVRSWPFYLRLEIRDSDGEPATRFDPGETVHYVFTVRNESSESQGVRLRTQQRTEYLALDEEGAITWRWSDGRLFGPTSFTWVFAPDEEAVFETTWDQLRADGTRAPAGDYRAAALVLQEKDSISANLVEIELRD